MALYAIGDLHLTSTSQRKMEEYDDIWIDHEKKIRESFDEIIGENDTVVLTGDHTWGGHLSTCKPDLEWLAELPGRKILLRGNHDIFWQVKKTKSLNSEFDGRLLFLQNNYYSYGDYALVGSKGYCYEPWDSSDDAKKRAPKRYERELARVQKSIEMARLDGFSKFIMFLHYPPTEIESSGCSLGGNPDSCFTELASECGAEMVVYSHLHGRLRFGDSLKGIYNGVDYRLVSADYLDFKPIKLLD